MDLLKSLTALVALLGAALLAGGCGERAAPAKDGALTANTSPSTSAAVRPAADSGAGSTAGPGTHNAMAGASNVGGADVMPNSGPRSSAAKDANSTRVGASAAGTDSAGAAGSAQTIRQAQRQLADKGHDPGPVDGVIGPQTRQAAKSFQQARGLEPNGELDHRTLSALGVGSMEAPAIAPIQPVAATTAGGSSRPAADGSIGKPATIGADIALIDRNFVSVAASAGMFEVEASKAAAERATDPAVKAFARRLIEDHVKTNVQLTKLAQAHGIELSPQLPTNRKEQLDELLRASGAAFDRQYVQLIGIKAHQDDIRTFEKASRDAKDSQIKAFASATLPALRKHLEHARMLPGGGEKGPTTSRSPTNDVASTSASLASAGNARP